MRTNSRVWLYAVLTLAGAITVFVILKRIIDPPPPPRPKPVYIVIVDNSYSTQVFCDKVAFWLNRYYQQADPEGKAVIIKMSRDATIIHDTQGLPTLNELRDNKTLAKLELDTRPMTRPLLAYSLAGEVVDMHSDRPVFLLIVSDGENDYGGDEKAIDQSCEKLLSRSNLQAVALVGADDDLRPKWMARFSALGAKAFVRGVSDATDGIDCLVRQ